MPPLQVLAPPGGQDHVNSLNLGREVPNSGNNYSRPNGQNSGNFITDRPSSRVLQAPGGASQIMFG